MTAISVIMPTYRAAKWTPAAIANLSSQTLKDFELIVVDDGSDDDTVAVTRDALRSFAAKWTIIELGVNRGPSAARNVGLAAATGDWVQYFDSDDLIPADKFEQQMAVCQTASADVTAVYAPYQRGYVDHGKITNEGALAQPDMEGRAPIMCLVGGIRPLLNAGLARRSALKQIGGFDEALRFWECEELTCRLAMAGRLMPAPSPTSMYFWRMHRGAIYIGDAAARYRSTPVALSWLELVLKTANGRSLDQLGLSAADRLMLLEDSTVWARLLYAHDRAAFRRYVALARRLDAEIRPASPAYLAAVSRYIGYEGAEWFGKLARKPKTWLARLCRKWV